MSVYIKGMEMPKSCSVCPMLEGDGMDGLCHAASKWLDDDEHWTWYVYPEGDMDDSKPRNCPLVFVPTQGRLIDEQWLKDAMITTLEALKKNPKMDRQEMHLIAAFDTLRCMVEDAPTIIEAEEGE